MDDTILVQNQTSRAEGGVPDGATYAVSAAKSLRVTGTFTAVPDLLLVGATCLGFIVLAVLISLATGAPFVVPTESVSPALGFNYSIPVFVGIGGYFMAQIALQFLPTGRRDRSSWRTGIYVDCYLICLFIVVIFVHFHIKMWMPIINPRLFDDHYYALDNHLRFLVNMFEWLHDQLIAFLPFMDSLYQTGLLAMFILSLWFHGFGKRRWYYHSMTAIILIEIIGPLTYLIAPAVGPFIFEEGPHHSTTVAQQTMYLGFQNIQAHGVAWLAQHGDGYFTSPLAAMPSLHVAAGWVLAYYAIKARLIIVPVMLCLLGMLTIDSVVLRWHYLLDIPMGLALAALVIAATNRVCRSRVEDAHTLGNRAPLS
jgi:hypothetical protein